MKKRTIIVAICFCILSFAATHIPLAMILNIDMDTVTEASCVWYGEDALEIFQNNYATKTYRPYIGRIGSTAFAKITLYNDGNEIAEVTDLGSLGLIDYKGIIFQERGCYADEGLKHIVNTVSSSVVFVFPGFMTVLFIAKLLSLLMTKVKKGDDDNGL